MFHPDFVKLLCFLQITMEVVAVGSVVEEGEAEGVIMETVETTGTVTANGARKPRSPNGCRSL